MVGVGEGRKFYEVEMWWILETVYKYLLEFFEIVKNFDCVCESCII